MYENLDPRQKKDNQSYKSLNRMSLIKSKLNLVQKTKR